MKSLFNKDNKGSSELKDLLGFIDVDIKYKNLKVDINQAAKEVKDVVGKEAYDKACSIYAKEELTEDEAEYLSAFCLPIAVRGYALYVPNGDISHTNNGRRMRMDETEKQAFEWLLDRDNEALERKYYRALDNLIEYLEENDADWKTSDSYKLLQKSLFPTTDSFDEFFALNSRLLLLKIQPGIAQCIRKEIKSRLPEDMYQILRNSPADLDEDILYEIKAASAYYALSWALPRLSVNMFSEGVLQAYTSDSQTTKAKKVPENNEIAWAKQAFDNDHRLHIVELESLIKKTMPDNEDDDCSGLEMNTIIGRNFIST